MKNSPITYDLVGTPSAPATLTATLTDNAKVVFTGGLPNVTLGVQYTPKSGQSNRYAILTVEVSNYDGVSAPPDNTFKPYSAALVVSSPNEVDLIPVVSAIGAGYGTPLILPSNSASPVSTGAQVYEATYNLTIGARHMRVSVREDGAANFGTSHVECNLSE